MLDRADLNDGDLDGFVRAGLHTRGGFTDRETVRAHVAHADDAALEGILRHFVRTFHHAVLAADTLIIEMPHCAGDGVFIVGEHGATICAAGVGAVMAGGGDVLLKCGVRIAERGIVAQWCVVRGPLTSKPTLRQTSSSSRPLSE